MSDPQKIREALSHLTPAEREDLEASLLSSLARSGRPLRTIVSTPNGPCEAFSPVVEIPAPEGYDGPRVIRLRRSSGLGLAGLDEETEP